jgi:hypothetical protein
MLLSPIAATTPFVDRRNLFGGERAEPHAEIRRLRRNPCDETSTMRSMEASLRLSTLSAWGFAVSRAERSRKATPET